MQLCILEHKASRPLTAGLYGIHIYYEWPAASPNADDMSQASGIIYTHPIHTYRLMIGTDIFPNNSGVRK